MPRASRLLILLLAAACGPGAPPPAGAPERAARPAATAPAVLQRVAVLGASASAGFHTRKELGFDLPLAVVLDRLLQAPHATVLDASSSRFFLSPDAFAQPLVDRARAYRPTLLVAVDFLFWFGYGAMEESERLASLERGLELLAGFDCPILLAELPDMRPAAEAGMLHAAQVPRPATLEALNARIRSWSEARPDVVLVPMARFLGRLRAGSVLELGGYRWPAGEAESLLQNDRLHPTLEGLAALGFLILDSYREAAGLDPEVLRRDPRALAADLLAEVDSDPEEAARAARRAQAAGGRSEEEGF